MEMPPIAVPTGAGRAAAAPRDDAEAHKAAQAFEAAFLSEMLKYTGLNAEPESFGGGAGEEAFASLLTDEYAKLLAERGGIGLAEQIFEVLKQRTRDA
jgi:Rod binding domain-containing protein